MYKSRENNIINLLPTFKNNKLQQLLTFGLWFHVYSLRSLELPSFLIIFKQIPHIMSFQPRSVQ